MDVVRDWAGLFAVLISIGATVFAWLTAGSKANAEQLAYLDRQMDAHDRRIAAIETEWKHLPDKETVHRLELGMSDVRGQLTSMVASAEATHRSMLRMEDYFMNNNRGGQ